MARPTSRYRAPGLARDQAPTKERRAVRPVAPDGQPLHHPRPAGRGRGRVPRRGACTPSGWASTWCCSTSTGPATPTPTDGRIPAPPGTGLLEPFTTLASWPPTPSTVRLGTAMVLAAPAQPGVHGQGGRHPRLAVGRTGRPRASASAGWRRSSRRSTCRGTAGARAPTSTSACCAPCGATTRRRSTATYRLPPCEMFPKPVQDPAPAHPHRRRERRRPATGGPARPGMAYLQPLARRAGGPAGPAGRAAGPGRAHPGRGGGHGLPLLP